MYFTGCLRPASEQAVHHVIPWFGSLSFCQSTAAKHAALLGLTGTGLQTSAAQHACNKSKQLLQSEQEVSDTCRDQIGMEHWLMDWQRCEYVLKWMVS